MDNPRFQKVLAIFYLFHCLVFALLQLLLLPFFRDRGVLESRIHREGMVRVLA